MLVLMLRSAFTAATVAITAHAGAGRIAARTAPGYVDIFQNLTYNII